MACPMRGPLSGMVTTSVGSACGHAWPGRGRVVEPAVVPADEEGDRAVAVRLERGLGRQHVGREAVVDELHRGRRGRANGSGWAVRGTLRRPRPSARRRRPRRRPWPAARPGPWRRCARCARPGRPSAPIHGPPKPGRRRRPTAPAGPATRPAPAAWRRSRRRSAVRTPGLVHSDSLSA